MSQNQRSISRLEYEHPFMVDVLHPIKSVKSIKKTGKTLGKQLKEVKKHIEQLEQMQKINSARLAGRRNAVDRKERQIIAKTLETLNLIEMGLTRSVIEMGHLASDLLLSSESGKSYKPSSSTNKSKSTTKTLRN